MPEHSVAALMLALAAPYALVLATPGPNLLLVLCAGLSRTSAGPVAAALGIACGATLAAVAAAWGASLFVADRPLQIAGAVVFAAVLTRSAAKLLREAGPLAPPGQDPGPARAGGAFAAGLCVALSNPMSVPFFLAFFVSQPLARTEAGVTMACATVFAMAGLWFAGLGLLVSRSSPDVLAALGGARFRRLLGVLMLVFAAASLARALIV